MRGFTIRSQHCRSGLLCSTSWARGHIVTVKLPVTTNSACPLLKCGPLRKVTQLRFTRGPRILHSLTDSGTKETTRTLRVHYIRRDKRYKGWDLHIWGGVQHPTPWDLPLKPIGVDSWGPFWDVTLPATSDRSVGLLIHKGDDKSSNVEVKDQGVSEVWLVSSSPSSAYLEPPDMSRIPAGTLSECWAHWVDRETLLWRVAARDLTEGPSLKGSLRQFTLYYSYKAQLTCTGEGIQGEEGSLLLTVVEAPVPPAIVARFPHLYGCTVLKVPPMSHEEVSRLMQCQLAVGIHEAQGQALDATGVQIQGALDKLFFYNGPLGDCQGEGEGAVVRLWAPTAQEVELLHWKHMRGGEPQVHPMAREPSSGVWSFTRPQAWMGECYTYRVKVYCPWTQKVEVTETTDPYSRCTTANGERTLVVDLDSPGLQPPGWHTHRVPSVEQFTDISIYELHIRDFSAHDPTVPEEYKGKYRAFVPKYLSPEAAAPKYTLGLRHLMSLSAAGLTHIHLLPAYDFGSVPERPEEQLSVQEDLTRFGPDSEEQQAAVAKVADQDAFNWGYDPVHYGVPEGSYSVAPDGPQRVLEFREMVQSLHSLGLQVVLDVVYNHTFRAGPHDRYSVLDKVVPGYYHRRTESGDICNSTCCNNTASEHLMCERLVVEDILHWAKNYKVDGFRFDIMGHLMLSTMEKIRKEIDNLTVEKDGVDGKKIYVYGEAWDFGEVAGNQRGRNASQLNLAGSRLGGFNDRMRDGAMGGNPYLPPDYQGFVTGLFTAPNLNPTQGSPQEQRQRLLRETDWVRLALAGNLREYVIESYEGQRVRGVKLFYHGNQPVAYGGDPCENVVFNGCHDNEALFDKVMMKAAPEVDAEGRARMCMLALALVVFSQGVAFIHAGDDLLRSKSLDHDSYNSGDWFNKLDWSMQDNNFGCGLPPASKNRHLWHFKRPLLQQVKHYKPSPDIIRTCALWFRTLLRVRYSSPLFRLPQQENIINQVLFHNTGPNQKPGVIIMELRSGDVANVDSSPATDSITCDPRYKRILVVFNALPDAVDVPLPGAASSWRVHPIIEEVVAQGDNMLPAGQQGAGVKWGKETQVDREGRIVVVGGREVGVLVEVRGE